MQASAARVLRTWHEDFADEDRRGSFIERTKSFSIERYYFRKRAHRCEIVQEQKTIFLS
jgi:hypothetical protein